MNRRKLLIMIGAVLCAATVAPAVSAGEPDRGARSANVIQSLTDRLQGRNLAFDRRRELRREARARWALLGIGEQRSLGVQFTLPASGEYQNVIRLMHGRVAHSRLRERGVRYHIP